MKHYRRIAAALLCAVTAVGITGCGRKSPEELLPPAPTADIFTSDTERVQEFTGAYDIPQLEEGTVLFEQDDVRVTVVNGLYEYTPDGMAKGWAMDVLIENDSECSVHPYVDGLAVNGLQLTGCYSDWSEGALSEAVGKRSSGTRTLWFTRELGDGSIKNDYILQTPKTITLYLRMRFWNLNEQFGFGGFSRFSDKITLTTDAAAPEPAEDPAVGNIIYETEQVTVSIQKTAFTGGDTNDVILYLLTENKSESPITFGMSGSELNGEDTQLEVFPQGSEFLAPGEQALSWVVYPGAGPKESFRYITLKDFTVSEFEITSDSCEAVNTTTEDVLVKFF